MTPFLASVLSPFSDGEGALTPAHIPVIVKIPWRFGTSRNEKRPSFARVRINAFISRAISPSPVCVLKVGEPVVGYIEPTNGDSKSAQLVSWRTDAVDSTVSFLVLP